MIDKNSLLIFLLMPPESPAHQIAIKALADIPLDSNDKEILGFLRGKPIEKEVTTLNKSLLDDLPNLFKIKNTLHPWRRLLQAIEMLHIADKPLPNVIIDNLISILRKESTQATEDPIVLLNYCAILIIATHGINGRKLARDQRTNTMNAIKAFLSSEQNDLQNIPKELHDSLKTIKTYLSHPEKKLRIYARNLCQQLSIPLSLNRMLTLAAADFDPVDSKQVNKTVIVIGETGSGKSTLVNSIMGHTTQRWALGAGMLDVGQADEKLPYAEVGHSGSKTLYVQRLALPTDAKTELVDTMGFHDTRNAEEGICAALGLPLFLKEKNINAILIVIPYNTFLPNNEGRGKIFRGLSRTLCGLIKLNELQKNFAQKLPIRFVITHLPEPRRDDAGFDVNKLQKNILTLAGELLAQVPSKDNLKDKKRELDTAKRELHNLLYKKSILLSFDFDNLLRHNFTHTYKIEWIKQALDAHEKVWIQNGMLPDIANKLKNALEPVLFLEPDARKSEIKKLLDADEMMTGIWQYRTKDLTEAVEAIEGQTTILNLLLTQQQLFLFRGHYPVSTKPLDTHDDLLALREYVAAPNTQTIPRDYFAFNPDDDNYRNAIEWLHTSANQLTDLMQRMVTIHNEILDLDAKLQKQEAESKHDHLSRDNFLEHLNGLFLSDLTIAIQSANNTSQKAATDLAVLRTDAKKLDDEIVALEQTDLIPVKKANYMVQQHQQSTSLLSQLQNLVTFHTETFSIKVDHPIGYVELSCVRNPVDGTLLFKTPFANKEQDAKVMTYPLCMERRDIMRVYAHTDELKKHDTGTFTLKAFNLEKGEITVEYQSKYNTNGEAGIQVFADAKRYAPHIAQLSTKKDKAKDLKQEMEQQAEAIEALKKSRSPEHHMQFIVAQPENKDHMQELNMLLIRLGYNREIFVKDVEKLPGLKLIIAFIDWQNIASQTQHSHQAIIAELRNKLLIARHVLNLLHSIYVKEMPRLHAVFEVCALFKITFNSTIIGLKAVAPRAAAAAAAVSPASADELIQNAALARLHTEALSATHPAIQTFVIKQVVAADHKTPDKAPGYSALFTPTPANAATIGGAAATCAALRREQYAHVMQQTTIGRTTP